jgi:integrase/recombinase XerD
MGINQVKFEIAKYKEQDVIFIHFDANPVLNLRVKRLDGVLRSRSRKAWYVPDTPKFRKKFGLDPKVIVSKKALDNIATINENAFKNYLETLEKHSFHPKTIITYRNEFAQLLQILRDNDVNNLTPDQLRSYFLFCIETLKLSDNTLQSRMNAVKFYFEQVLEKANFFSTIPRPKKPSSLPKTINSKDIQKLLNVTPNIKHNTMLRLCYDMGLRVSEIVNLKITDIDSKNMQLLIAETPTKKAHFVNLTEPILLQLRAYFKEYRPKEFLFEGKSDGAYSIRSTQQVFADAMQRAKIKKNVGVYGQPQNFATQLIESGIDEAFMEKLLVK